MIYPMERHDESPKTISEEQLWGEEPMDDICENSHRGNAESRDAFSQVEPKIGALREQLLGALASRDLTSKELVCATHLSLQTVSARLSELKKIGRIEPTGVRRQGCAVLTLVKGRSRYRATEFDLF